MAIEHHLIRIVMIQIALPVGLIYYRLLESNFGLSSIIFEAKELIEVEHRQL